MRYNTNLISLTFIILLFLVGCASSYEGANGNLSAKQLYTQAKGRLDNGAYDEAIQLYSQLETSYLYGRYAQQAQLEIAYAYYKSGQPDSAIIAADRFIKLYPTNPNVDYAYYLRGLAGYRMVRPFLERFFKQDPSERDPQEARQSFDYFTELVKRFPKSRYVNDSLQRMIHLRNSLAQYEIHVANYYFDRKAYLAAANRAKYVVENYQRTPVVGKALQIMVKAYRKLNLDDLANDAQRVLELNHPEDENTTKRKTGNSTK